MVNGLIARFVSETKSLNISFDFLFRLFAVIRE